MRPLKLHFEGLRSYRDPVTVDFEWLGQQGLFGIVGPTGAGKSTVLDALFLALYGLTPRSNGAGEFVRPDVPVASVDLTFAITRAGQRETWRVRREWRRARKRGSGELSPDVGAPRVELHRVVGGREELVSERAREVDAEIEERVVGIPFADFTKAIVLPQGQFDQLLHTKPAERAKLLGRVFGLTRFGAALHRRAQDKRLRLDDECKRLEAQAEQCKVTPEQVEAARAALVAAQGKVEAAQELLAEAELVARRATAGAEVALRLSGAREESAGVAAQRAQVEEMRSALEQAERAARVWPQVQRQLEARERVARLEERARQQADEAARLAGVHARREAEAVGCEAQRTRLEPEAEALVQRARDAREQDRQAAQHATAAARAQGELRRIDAELAGFLSADQERALAVAAALDLRDRAEAGHASLQVSPEERARTQGALEAALAFESAHRDLEEARAQLAQRALELEAREAEVLAAGELAARAEEARAAAAADPALAVELAALEQQGQALRTQVDAARHFVAALAAQEEELAEASSRETAARDRHLVAADLSLTAGRASAAADAALREAEEGARRAEGALQDAGLRAQAAVLAQELVVGEACPVCGSAEHPHPARDSADTEAARRALELARSLQAGARDASQRAALEVAKARLEEGAAAEGLAEARRQRGAREGRRTETLGSARALAALPWETPASRGPAVAALEQEWLAFGRRSQQLREAASAAGRRAADTTTQALVAQATLQEKRASAARQAEGVQVGKTAFAAKEQLFAESAVAWNAAREGLGATEARQRQQALADRDHQAAAHAQVAAAQRERLRALEAEAKQELVRKQALAGGREGQRATFENEARHAEARRREVALVTQGADPQAFFESAAEALDELRRAARESRAGADQARKELDAAELLREAAVAGLGQARGEAGRHEEAVATALRESGFPAAEDARAAQRPEAERATMSKEIKAFDGRAAAAASALKLAEEAAGAFGSPLPSAGEVALARQRQEDARAACDEALVDSTRQAAALGVLGQNAAEGARLRGRLGELAPALARAGRLAKLLEGEKLVGFAADRFLVRILAAATGNLRLLSSERYDLLRGDDGAFAVRDRHQAGVIRGAGTLSGGESFLTSLALALALSDHIQQQGSVRFDFFFLDEGFGSLDEETLSVAIDALEKLRGLQRTIGTISHVPALHERLPRRLVVRRAPPGGSASVVLES